MLLVHFKLTLTKILVLLMWHFLSLSHCQFLKQRSDPPQRSGQVSLCSEEGKARERQDPDAGILGQCRGFRLQLPFKQCPLCKAIGDYFE